MTKSLHALCHFCSPQSCFWSNDTPWLSWWSTDYQPTYHSSGICHFWLHHNQPQFRARTNSPPNLSCTFQKMTNTDGPLATSQPFIRYLPFVVTSQPASAPSADNSPTALSCTFRKLTDVGSRYVECASWAEPKAARNKKLWNLLPECIPKWDPNNSLLVGVWSPVNHYGLHLGWLQTLIYISLTLHRSHFTQKDLHNNFINLIEFCTRVTILMAHSHLLTTEMSVYSKGTPVRGHTTNEIS